MTRHATTVRTMTNLTTTLLCAAAAMGLATLAACGAGRTLTLAHCPNAKVCSSRLEPARVVADPHPLIASVLNSIRCGDSFPAVM